MSFYKENVTKYCSIIGAHFVTAPVTVLWIYGNLFAYVDSYFQFACSPQCMDSDSEWILGVSVVMICPGTLITKYLASRIGLKWAGALCALVLGASLFGSAWAVQVSVALTTILFGAVTGFTIGLTSVVAFENVTGWAPEKAPLFMATTTVTPTLLSMVINQVITAVVNPENLKPNAIRGSKTFFSQPEVLSRVPRALIVYAAILFSLQFIGYLLLATPPKLPTPSENTAIKSPKVREEDDIQNTKNADASCLHPLPKSETMVGESEHGDYGSTEIANRKSYPSTSGTSTDALAMRTPESKYTSSEESEDKVLSLKPSEVLTTPSFYAIFMYAVASVFSLMLKGNYYKQFGLLYIHNDRFLTMVGTLIPVVAATSRFFIGASLNRKILTTKDTIVICLSVNSVLCAFWFFVPQVNAVLYLFFMLCLAVVQSQYYAIMPVACLEIFGPAHFSTNYGLLLSSFILVGLLSPVVISPLLQTLGWFWLFGSASILSSLTLTFVVCCDFRPPQPREL